MLEVTCPYCRHAVQVEDEALSKKQRCPNCGASFLANPADASLVDAPTGMAPGHGISQLKSDDSVSQASLICSLIVCIPVIPQLLGIVLGIIALARPIPPESRRSGMAFAGLIISMIVMACWAGFYFSTIQPVVTIATTPMTPYAGGWGNPYVDIDPEVQAKIDRILKGLDELDKALDGYVADFGRWPDSVEVLTPDYLDTETAGIISIEREPSQRTIVLKTGIDPVSCPSDAVIAYSEIVDVNTNGEQLNQPHRWVLRRHGKFKLEDAGVIEEP